MAISLMPDIPDQLVIWGIINIVQCDREFHHPKAGGEMTTMDTHHIYDELAEFIADLVQLLLTHVTKVFGELDVLQQRSGFHVHD